MLIPCESNIDTYLTNRCKYNLIWKPEKNSSIYMYLFGRRRWLLYMPILNVAWVLESIRDNGQVFVCKKTLAYVKYIWSKMPTIVFNCGFIQVSLPQPFNSLWPSDAMRRQRTEFTLAQLMACCLTAPSHYLEQCWLIISKVLWHSSEGIIMRRSEDTNQ